jgi:hypothetical protein
MPDLTKHPRLYHEMVAGVLKPGELAAACISVTLPPLGNDWLEGARAPAQPGRADRVLDAVLDPVDAVVSQLETALGRGQPKPPVALFSLKAAGARGSWAYQLVYTTRDRLKRLDSLYCVVTGERAVFARRPGTQRVLELLLDMPLSEISGVARKRELLTFSHETLAVAFCDSSLVTLIVSRRDASRLAGLLAPGGGRAPRPGDYAPPWESHP